MNPQQQIIENLADIYILSQKADEPPQADVAFWNRFVSISYKWESRFIRGYGGKEGLARLFIRQGQDAVARIEGRKGIKQFDASGLIDWTEYEILYEEFGQLLLPLIASDYGSRELTRLVAGISFDVVKPEVVEFARDYSVRFAKSVNEETLRLLSAELAKADQLGEGIPQITKRIQALFANMTKARAYMTARTETMRAQNYGAEMGYIASTVVESKRWLVAHDERACPWCLEMGNKDPFKLGENYFEQGESMTVTDNGKTRTITFNYEPIARPPLHPYCYSDDTEMYTNKGWQLFKDVEIGQSVLTLNKESKGLEWGNIKEKISRRSEFIYHLTNRQNSFSMMVTEDHPFFGYKRVDHGIEGRQIEPVLFDGVHSLNSEFKFYISSKYFNLSPSHFVIDGLHIEIDQFCRLMGYFLSEGSIVKRKRKGEYYWYQISIAQTHYLDEMWDDLKTLNVRKIWLGKDRITILDERLGKYLSQFGKSHEKFIPDEIKQLSPIHIRTFLDAYLLGDGSIQRGKQWKSGTFKDSRTYSTNSKRIADGLGELLIKTGKSVSYRLNKVQGKTAKFKNGEHKINYDQWIIYELNSQYKLFQKIKIEKLEYNRFAYDVEVDINNTILTRHSGKVVWGSNCRCCLSPVVTL